MKGTKLVIAIAAAAVVVGACALRAAAQTPGKEMAVVDLPDQTRMMKVTLQGKYIFVHDDLRMAKGDPCFYVYKYNEDATGKPLVKDENLVLSFHCQHLERPKARQIVLTYVMVAGQPDLFEIREVQF